MKFQFVGDIVEKNGKTIKENNMAIKHKIPIGDLVEITPQDYNWSNMRLYVVTHERDCDGTPLYGLGEFDGERILGPFSEGSLKIVKATAQQAGAKE